MAKDKPDTKAKADELATTADEAPAVETQPEPVIPTRAAKRAKSKFTVTDLGAVKFEGKFHGTGSVLELTEEQAAAFGSNVTATEEK